MTGWELLMSAAVSPSEIEQVCVRVGQEFGEVPVADAEAWLSQMSWFTSPEDEGWTGHPTKSAREEYEFQVWTAGRIYRSREHEGLMTVISWPRTPAQWTYITSRFEPSLIEIESGIEWSWGKPEAAAKPNPPSPRPPVRVMTPIERQDFMTIVASIQRLDGESLEDWQARYRHYEETGETDIPDDVRQRLRKDGESLEAYLERMKAANEGDET